MGFHFFVCGGSGALFIEFNDMSPVRMYEDKLAFVAKTKVGNIIIFVDSGRAPEKSFNSMVLR